MNWEILKPFLAGYARKALTAASIYLMTKGVLPSAEQNEFVGAGMLFASVAWEGVHLYGQAAIGALLKKITAAPTLAAAVAVAAKTAPGVGVIQSTVVPITKAIVLLAILVIGTLMVATPSYAEIKKPAFTGHLAKDVETDLSGAAPAAQGLDTAATNILAKPFQDLANFLSSDAAAAIALSTQIPALQDGHGQQCWTAMATAGDVFKAHPVPLTFKVMTDVEALRLLQITANNLCINVHCTQVFADLSAMAQAASPAPLPIPSLHDLCSKIPQIALIAPVLPPAPAAAAAPAK